MNNYRWKIVSAICLAAAFVGYIGFNLIPRHRIVEGIAARIRPGMSQADVEAILGGPPGEYGPESVSVESRSMAIPEFPKREQTWIAGYLAISVLFDADGKVLQSRESRRMIGDETWNDKVRRWFRLKG